MPRGKGRNGGRDTDAYSNTLFFFICPNIFFFLLQIWIPLKKTNSMALVNTISSVSIDKNGIKEVGVKHQKIYVIECCMYAF